jgi:hypothetical protein
MDRKFTRILAVTRGPELALKPSHRLGEERGRPLRKRPAVLVQFRAQPAQRTSAARELLAVVMYAVHEGEQPFFR